MAEGIDPGAAEEALAVVRQQRTHAARASREPWWAWVAAFLVASALLASYDFKGLENLRSVAVLPIAGLVLAWTCLPRRFPRIARALGRDVELHRSVVPLSARLGVMVG